MLLTREQLVAKRFDIVQTLFHNLAPLWLMNDTYRARENSFYFNVVYYHPVHAWINQHIRYDTFNDVLYHMGETRVADTALLQIQEQDPYIPGNGTASIPNNPAGRF